MTERAVRFACVAILVAAAVGGLGATAPGASAQPTDTIAQTGINPDDVSMRITLRPDGDAAWAIDYRVRLDDNETTDAFLSLREDIRANESQYASEFDARMESTASAAENATGREMAIRNVSVTATRQQLPQDYGIVTYTFVWTNFSAVDDGTIRAGDALAGLFLDSETSLQFAWPEGYALESVRPEPTDTRRESRIVVWSGPLDFGPNEPAIVVSEAPTARTDEPTTGEPGTPTPADSGLVGYTPALAGAVLLALALAVVAGGGYLLRRDPSRLPWVGGGRDGAAPDSGGSTAGTESAASATGTAEADAGAGATAESGPTATDADSGAAESAPGDSAATEPAADEGAAATDGDDESETPPWEDELLSNEERVLALVEHEGGRMKQQEVAQTLDWTDAKTSQVVRKMRDEDDLDAFRLGRENVLVLPDEGLGPEGDE